MKRFTILFILILATFFSGCSGPSVSKMDMMIKKYQTPMSVLYPEFYNKVIKKIIVLPPVNNTTNDKATKVVYYLLIKALEKKGYEVVSEDDVQNYLKLHKREIVFDDTSIIDELEKDFKVDAIVFSDIHTWEKNVGLFDNSAKIKIYLKIVDAHEKNTILKREIWNFKNSNTMTGLYTPIILIPISILEGTNTDLANLADEAINISMKFIPYGVNNSMYNTDKNKMVFDNDAFEKEYLNKKSR